MRKNCITQDDKEFIKNNYTKIPVEEIAKHIGKSSSTIYSLVNELGVGRYDWTDDRILILKDIYPSGNWDLLFEKLETRDKDGIRHKACQLNIKMENIDYTVEQINFLKENYNKVPIEEIAVQMNRKSSAIYAKINDLGLFFREKWTAEDLKLLGIVYPNYTNEYIQKTYFPSRNIPMILSMGLKMGFHKSSEKSLKWYEHENLISRLKGLANLLGRTPRICELGLYNLPSEASYRRYFGSYLNACEIADLDIDYIFFGKTKGYLYASNGERCYSKAELTITDFFIVNKIEYKKDQYYRNYISDSNCKTKKVDWVLKNNIFVEYFGIPEKSYYYEKMQIKREICRDNDIELIELFFKDIKSLNKIFDNFINKNP